MKKLAEKDCLTIINLYYDNNVEDIAKIYNINPGTVYNILKKYNAPTKVQLLKINTQEIISLYNDYSVSQIASIYNVSKKTILNLLHDNNVKMRDAKLCHRKYMLNEFYFDTIDSQEKAYILGLLWADGYNDEKGHISISLQEQDIDILEKIKKQINTNIPLNYRKFSEYRAGWKNQYRLFINSKHISKKLSEYGMYSNKSLTAKFPDWLDKKLYPHFIRGYLDGDGHIGNRLVSFAGSIYLIPKIKEILENECEACCYIYKGTGCLNLHINKKQSRANVLNYMYKNANIYLQRKYDKYLEMMAKINKS